jgi:seryl-tRNA synthetase
MLDLQWIKTHQVEAENRLKAKGFDIDFSPILIKDDARKKYIHQVETLKAEANQLSASVPQLKKNGQDVSSIFTKVKSLNADIKEIEQTLAEISHTIESFMLELPNLPDADLKAGGKEQNEVVEILGQKQVVDFKIKDHVELAESLGIIDYTRAAKISGSGSWIYSGLGAQLEWALLNFFIEEHLKDGYQMMLLPHMLNEASGVTAGQFPKFKDDVFWIAKTDKFLLPTAETALVNLHRDEILKEEDLPKKYFAYTPCYRYEAGSYRAEERGMIRGYQFNKVELVQYTKPDQSDAMFEELLAKAKRLMTKLGLHFQMSRLAAGDCSFAMARTYDIEVYIPSLGIYKEVSSVSNARDFQARRGMMRYRDNATNKTAYLHTLNASGLATSRVLPALLEQYQQADGSVMIPEVLQNYMGGITRLTPK